MIDLGGYIEYLRHDKDTRYSDSTNAAIQDERLKIADDLERMLSNAAQGVGDPVVTCGRCAIPYARIPKDGRCHMCGSPLAPAAARNEGEDKSQRDAYDLGWIGCANWADRDDLIADIDSPAYIKDRDKALASSGSEGGDGHGL